jgi:Lrp/AsnC family transcriptional regulator, regulator for asnA, asnC and gidA
VAVTDPLQIGFHSQAMVGIRADGDARKVAAQLAEVTDIDYVVMCAGSFDILVELVCEDEDTLLDLLNGVIRQIPGVRETEIFMYLKLSKQTYTWGTR